MDGGPMRVNRIKVRGSLFRKRKDDWYPLEETLTEYQERFPGKNKIVLNLGRR